MATTGNSVKHGPQILYVVAVFVLVATLIVLWTQGVIGWKEIGIALLTMLGTFFGALFAFRLNENKENAKLDSERRMALNCALFVGLRQHNAILTLKTNLDQYKTEFDRAFNCPAFLPPKYDDLMQDVKSLYFLLGTTDGANVLLRLSLAQETFHLAIEALRLRNIFFVDVVQPAIGKTGINRRSVSLEECEKLLGEEVYGRAMNQAASLYELVDHLITRLWSMHCELGALAANLYNDTTFVDIARDSAGAPVLNQK